MEGQSLPKRAYEQCFLQLFNLSKGNHQNTLVYFEDSKNVWESVERQDCVFEFWYGDEFVGTCIGKTPDTCEWTWNTNIWTQWPHLEVSPLWNRIDFIWGKATNNIAWFEESEPVTESSRKILWYCVMLARHVWSAGRVLEIK